MNEFQLRTVEQVRQMLARTQALWFRRAEDDEGRCAWIDAVLRRFEYRQLPQAHRGPVLASLQRQCGCSRAPVPQLVSRWGGGKRLVKNCRAREHAFARRCTSANGALLADVDRAMGTMSGSATLCVLRRQRDGFGDAHFERLGGLWVAHRYKLRHRAPYRAQRVVLTKTRPTQVVTVGVRHAPARAVRPRLIRIDGVHQGDWDGSKGLHHINAVDCVNQWQAATTVQTLSEAQLLPVIQQLLAQFSFEVSDFNADNLGGSGPHP